MEKYTSYCLQRKQDHMTTTTTNKEISAKQQMTITDTNRRMCHTATESTTHVLSACSKIAQTLYTARYDRMLRPIYHCLLHTVPSESIDPSGQGNTLSLPRVQTDRLCLLRKTLQLKKKLNCTSLQVRNIRNDLKLLLL